MCVFSSCYSRRTRRQQHRRKKKKKTLRDKRLEANAQTRLGIGIRVPMGKKKKEWMREGAGVGVDDGDEDDDGIVDDVKRARERGNEGGERKRKISSSDVGRWTSDDRLEPRDAIHQSKCSEHRSNEIQLKRNQHAVSLQPDRTGDESSSRTLFFTAPSFADASRVRGEAQTNTLGIISSSHDHSSQHNERRERCCFLSFHFSFFFLLIATPTTSVSQPPSR